MEAVAIVARVRLRCIRPADVDRFLVWAGDSEVRRHYLGAPGDSDGDPRSWVPQAGPASRALRDWRPAGQVVRVIESADGLPLGWVELRDLNWRRRSGELRICLGERACWGRGLGTAALRLFLAEAFDAWGLESVHLRVATWNVRAVRAYRRCGFRRTGRLSAGDRAGAEDLWLMTLSAERHASLAVEAAAP